jgi:hypothetical protein
LIVMRKPAHGPELLIVAGGVCFIAVLALSAYWDAPIRWLHFLQAWMYVAAIVLTLRRSRWGYFIGLAAAAFWDYATLFVNTFFVNGLRELARWLHSGRLARPDLLIAVPAWFSNLAVIAGCLWAYGRLRNKHPSDALRFAVALIATTAFFAAAMALSQPRYLALFPQLLHPHPPFR